MHRRVSYGTMLALLLRSYSLRGVAVAMMLMPMASDKAASMYDVTGLPCRQREMIPTMMTPIVLRASPRM